ncbi:MAG: hypothetical protein QOG64_244 [Acidimicrobiaceae bacterium]|nr:hypothetical protein [Acidimicrobiaceae bacterium]
MSDTDATTGDPDRVALEERRARAIRDIVETEKQRDAGELDDDTAARLTKRFEAEVVAALEGLDALGPPEAPDPWSRGRMIAIVAVLIVASVVAGVVVTSKGRPHAAATTATTATGGRDLSTVSNQEMEAVIAKNPTIVPMRLALAERYLTDGNFAKASEHAHLALEQNPEPADRARALRDLGWASANQGKPDEGAQLLQQSLDLAPNDKNALFFLARVRLDGLADPKGAVTLLQQLLDAGIDDATVRAPVQQALDQANAAAANG